ncbi:MAG TPA: inositol monophosphatase family protein [Solirubrobacteraceae bacterium]|jgi:myo-inositol-1(or 4)-monophosphatase|nr:inositol monophosphatase family protein [Solirubrobacteraceae bacterium]
MPDTQEDLLAVAHEAARAAGEELVSRFGRAQMGVRTKSGPTDLVSEADLAAERAIRSVLSARRPDDTVIGEEGGAVHGSGELRWVVDPLDGTVNFLFGIPMFAVSVACEDAAGVAVGVVLDPVRDECFAATRSSVGATLNGAPIRGSTRDEISTAMVATGFTYNAATRVHQASLAARVIPAVRDIRRCGAAALDLCWTACGRFDAFYERGLNAWDVAAGSLVCTRAGLDVRVLPGTEHENDGVIVAPAGLFEALWDLVV